VIENVVEVECVGLAWSVILATNVDLLAFVGVSEITPLWLSLRPLGRCPPFLNLYGNFPSHPLMVAE
jgi:hypothetical protein